ncbi:MAG: SpoIID/LytB domain-containing protein [Rhabdochlamydiaceae bacterium]|jgi:stage II sporulation protein D
MKTFKTLLAASLVASPFTPLTLFSAGIEIPTDISQKEKPATIRVLISKQKEKILLEAKGHHYIYNPLNDILLEESSSTTKHWLSTQSNGLRWGELWPAIFQIRIVPANAQSTILVDGIEYRGCVEIYDLKGKLYLINEVDIERYLKSIMTTQFSTEIDEEVMDAVAITARTHAYYLASRKPDVYWHVESQDVGYEGYAVSLQNLHINRAINHTRHMVMLYKGAPFPTAWTKDCAGKTTDFATIFRKDVRTPHGVESPFALHDREKHAWKFLISKKELASALGAVKVNEFELYQDDKSQKVYGARLKDNADILQFDFTQLQSALGAARLKSNDFTIEASGDQITFKGFGEGNGVGLCLFSASAMADKGDKAPKILATFFPDSQLENIPSFTMKTVSNR